MQTFVILLFVGAVAAVFGLSIVFGNPVMLPKHPGYPMGTSSVPVYGHRLPKTRASQKQAESELSIRRYHSTTYTLDDKLQTAMIADCLRNREREFS